MPCNACDLHVDASGYDGLLLRTHVLPWIKSRTYSFHMAREYSGDFDVECRYIVLQQGFRVLVHSSHEHTNIYVYML